MRNGGRWENNSLVQVIERVGDAHRHLHASLARQLLDSCISLFPKGLRVIFIRQATDLPLLENEQ